MTDKKEIEKSLEYSRGYREALVNTWEEVLKMATKGYSSQEMQIIVKTKSHDAKHKIELKIEGLETKLVELVADLAQDDIIDVDDGKPLIGLTEAEPIIEVHMSPRLSYLVREPKPKRCYDMVQKEIGKNRPTLIIARTPTIDIREKYDIGKSQVIWLTMSERFSDNLPPLAQGAADAVNDIAGVNDEYVKPGELPKLYSLALNFIDGNNDGVILFEGFEYLNTHNSFQSLMNFLQKLNENIVENNFNMILSANPAAFEPKQFSQFESEISKVL
ncbi:MAG: DUF835 domain-containing protein [Thermoplasmata archaeon]|nr:DUF835 domain-containing protein [Thermoplasmata archaeon]